MITAHFFYKGVDVMELMKVMEVIKMDDSLTQAEQQLGSFLLFLTNRQGGNWLDKKVKGREMGREKLPTHVSHCQPHGAKLITL